MKTINKTKNKKHKILNIVTKDPNNFNQAL